jgi:hypothetical protein
MLPNRITLLNIPRIIHADGSASAIRIILDGRECIRIPERRPALYDDEDEEELVVNGDSQHLGVNESDEDEEAQFDDNDDEDDSWSSWSEDDEIDIQATIATCPNNVRKRARLVESTFSDTCNICLETYKEQDKITTMVPCAHVFHTECIRAWEVQQKTAKLPCPCCRSLNEEQ